MGLFPCRLLLDLPNWLGDFIHALPALHTLLLANREGETFLLVPAGHQPLAARLGGQVLLRPAKAGLGFARQLPKADVVLSFRHSTRAKFLLWSLRASRALASEGRGAGALGLEVFPVDRRRHQRHDVDAALERLGLPPVDGQPSLLPGARLGPRQRGPVVLLPGSHREDRKRYPKEGYAFVGKALAHWGFPLAVVVGKGDAELGNWLAQKVSGELFPPQASLQEVAGFLASARLAVGNDSGLTHLAAAVGCPTVALFGPTCPQRTAPCPGVALAAGDFPALGWKGLPPAWVLSVVASLLLGPRHLGAALGQGLQDRAEVITIRDGGGPLAQLAEQGTLNP